MFLQMVSKVARIVARRSCGTVRYGIYAMRQQCAIWHGTVQYSTVWFGTVRWGAVRYGAVRYGAVRYSKVQYVGTVGCGAVRYER